jgi:putative redox protein
MIKSAARRDRTMADAAAKAPHERVAIVSEDMPKPLGNRIAIGPHRLRADEPVENGGHATGPDPYEYLLAGLGVCTSMTVRLYANHKGWPLEHIEVRVRHAERMTGGAGKDVFTREITLTGDLSDEERERLLAIAERCPVSRTLSAGVTIRSSLADPAPVGEASA